MKLILLTILLTLINCSTHTPVRKVDGKLSIVQGVTSSKEVEFSVMAPNTLQPHFELRSADGEIINPEEVKKVSRPFSPFTLHKLLFLRDMAKVYNLIAYNGEEVIDQRLVGRGQAVSSKIKFAVASCMNDYDVQDFGIWNTLASKNPEYLLLIGDNVYSDRKGAKGGIVTSPEIIWQRYTDVRSKLPIYFMEKLIPIHAIWDDHDYGINDGDSSFEHKKASQEIFEAFWAQDLSSESWTKGPGVSGQLTLGDFNLYFLDGRSFRSPAPEGKHLGIDQHKWLLTKLTEEASPSFLIKGDQFFGGYHEKNSYEGKHPQDFSNFIAELKKLNTPFNFISGDRHMSEIMQFPRGLFGTPSFEITSSPIHAVLEPKDLPENPWRVVSEQDHINFTVVDNHAVDNHLFMNVENIGKNGDLHFKRELAVYIKDLQNNLDEVRKRRQGGRRYQRRKRR